MPFWLRRPFLIVRDLLASRDRPDLRRLGRIADPETFVWSILPHAARTFSACIALLPARPALVAAVAYLYCRMLDTYEDLVPDPAAREESLRAFAERLRATGPSLAPAPSIYGATDRDDRDRAHLLLVHRAGLVDRVFLSFDAPARQVIHDLVREMALGMVWSSATFQREGGVLATRGQLVRYCRNVLGNPVVFCIRLMRLEAGMPPELGDDEREDAMRVGEMVQLANITRDIEKDLSRGIAYDTALRNDLWCDALNGDRALSERCRAVRERLLRMALERVPSYGRVIAALRLPPRSVARSSGVLMLLFTERYFRACARRAGMTPWEGPGSILALFRRSIPGTFSVRRAEREIARVEHAFLHAARFSPG